MGFDAASSVGRIVQYFNPATQLVALKKLQSNLLEIEEADRRAIATIAVKPETLEAGEIAHELLIRLSEIPQARV